MNVMYQKSVVAFVDILGFQMAVENPNNVKNILSILKQFKTGDSEGCSSQLTAEGTTVIISLNPTVTAFSDSIVISIPENVLKPPTSWCHAIIEVLNRIQILANRLIQDGFLLRGGITIGDLHHEDGIVFGPGLNRAYELESKAAKFPRVLASQEVIDAFNTDTNGGASKYFILDQDEKYFLDYLSVSLESSKFKTIYKENIKSIIKDKENCIKSLKTLDINIETSQELIKSVKTLDINIETIQDVIESLKTLDINIETIQDLIKSLETLNINIETFRDRIKSSLKTLDINIEALQINIKILEKWKWFQQYYENTGKKLN